MLTKSSVGAFPWRTLAVESLVVVLSVLLALGVDSWRQSRAERHLALEALQGILDEARSNCERVLKLQGYHEAVIAGDTEPQGIQIGLLRNDAWDVAKSIGAPPHLPHDVVAAIAAMHAQQSDHRTIVQAYIQSLFTLGLSLEEGEQLHVDGERYVIADLARTQRRLLDAYATLERVTMRYHAGEVTITDICPAASD